MYARHAGKHCESRDVKQELAIQSLVVGGDGRGSFKHVRIERK